MSALTRNPPPLDSLLGPSGDPAGKVGASGIKGGSPAILRDHDLGFGFNLREAWLNPAGRLGFALKIVYRGKRPISCEARPVMNYGGLRRRYLAVLSPAFQPSASVEGASAFLPLHWNLDSAAQLLPVDSLGSGPDSLPSAQIQKTLAYYMTPYSGTLYGIRGGEAGQMLENRDQFLDIEKLLSADRRIAAYLLRSINPATRLSAAEFILKHKPAFAVDWDWISGWMDSAFKHPRLAATMRAKAETREDGRKLADEFSKQEITRDQRGVLRMY